MTIKTRIGNITGTMDVLNEISLAFDLASKLKEQEGRPAIAKRFEEVSNEIYFALDDKDYYKH